MVRFVDPLDHFFPFFLWRSGFDAVFHPVASAFD
jgi:hypothetical protein